MTHSARCYDVQGRPTGTRRLFTPDEEARLEALRHERHGPVPDSPVSPAGSAGRWSVVATEPQAEGLAAGGLVGEGFAAYAPTFMKRVPTNYGSRVINRPLFPGYVLLRLDLSDPRWPRLFATPGVRGLLTGAGDRPAAIDEDEVAIIRAKEAELDAQWHALESGDVDALPFGLGDRVHLDDPMWTGMIGTIERLDDMERITVLMALFGRETRVVTSASRIRSL